MEPEVESKDPLGDRMKAEEHKTRVLLPKRTYTLLRVDGKAFHTYTRNCARPFDLGLMADMDETALALCRLCEGAKFAFVQSDEISVLLTDFGKTNTDAWFGGNIQKIASVSASIATAYFNQARTKRESDELPPPALFDSRVWSLPDANAVCDYFLWRQLDAMRNSVTMTARAHFSHKQVQEKSSGQLRQMLQEAGADWENLPDGFKQGRIVHRVTAPFTGQYTHKRTGQVETFSVIRQEWHVAPAPLFAQNRDWLSAQMQKQNEAQGG